MSKDIKRGADAGQRGARGGGEAGASGDPRVAPAIAVSDARVLDLIVARERLVCGTDDVAACLRELLAARAVLDAVRHTRRDNGRTLALAWEDYDRAAAGGAS